MRVILDPTVEWPAIGSQLSLNVDRLIRGNSGHMCLIGTMVFPKYLNSQEILIQSDPFTILSLFLKFIWLTSMKNNPELSFQRDKSKTIQSAMIVKITIHV